MNIHEQYKGIIDILKSKITETDNLIKVKKAAKGEFTYALSKNLLKTISNLSL
jgi:chaperonin GroEL (HSP60 family)